ncbi:MAG: SOS response-associated peptidase [Cyclobacteriaceae bacterium]|nr:SOS response-associated peptidase [Cyclobacteriaceae bacterium]
MISRYSLTLEATAITERFGADPTEAYRPLFNAAPTHLLPVITNESPEGVSFFYWGATPVWGNKQALGERIINTHAEVISEKNVLKKKLREHRCLVPADGFYVWKRIGKKASVPYRFTLPDKGAFGMAALWEEFDDAEGNVHHTFNLITTISNASVLPFSERMPAILAPGSEKAWLNSADEAACLGMLGVFSGLVDHYSVASQINDPGKNDRTMILPAPAADQFGNMTLFD